MRNLTLALALLALLSIVACQTSNSGEFDMTAKEGTVTHMVADGLGNNSMDVGEVAPKALENRKMIWTANMDLQVSSMDTATTTISKLAASKGGFVSDLKMSSNNYAHTNTLTIRIPNEEFHSFISATKSQAKFVKSVEISSSDVTAQYIDIESRLESKKEARKRYMDILRNKTGDIEAVIEAEDAIRRITEEIESRESRLRSMQDQIALSTVKVTLIEKTTYKEEPATYEKTFGDDASAALANGWGGIKFFVLILLNIWPLLLLVLLFVWFVVRMTRKSKRKKTSAV